MFLKQHYISVHISRSKLFRNVVTVCQVSLFIPINYLISFLFCFCLLLKILRSPSKQKIGPSCRCVKFLNPN